MAEQQQDVKLFVGGVSYPITEESLRDYFTKYGTVVETYIRRDSGRTSRGGFGFVTFSDAESLTRALQDQQEHSIQGQKVEVKRAMNRSHRNFDGNSNNNSTLKKIFVGGLSSSLTEDEFKSYFERFGRITDVVVMHDSETGRPRGFGFITFESEESVEQVLQQNFYELNGKLVEVKKAVPKEANNSHKNGYNMRMGGGRPSSFPQYGHNMPYPPSPGYDMLQPYYPYSPYSCSDNYCYATSMYTGGYFMGESGGVDYGSTSFRPPWCGPGTLGNGVIYHPYSSGMVGLLDRAAGSANGFAGPIILSRWQADVIPTPSQIEPSMKDTNGNANPPPSLVLNNSDGGKLDTLCVGEDCDSAGEKSGCGSLKDTNDNANPPSLVLNNSDGGKLDTLCDGEVCESAGENCGCGSLKEDGADSSDLKEDGCEFSAPLKVNCVASTSDSNEDGTPSDFFGGDGPLDIKDGGAASSSGSYDDGATLSLDTDTDDFKCNGGASYSSCGLQNLKELEEQLTPSSDCDSS